jgi:phosphopantetheinyl transferase (holo-ACP synthase)
LPLAPAAVYAAAESALKAVVTKSGAQLSLREVPLETLQVGAS